SDSGDQRPLPSADRWRIGAAAAMPVAAGETWTCLDSPIPKRAKPARPRTGRRPATAAVREGGTGRRNRCSERGSASVPLRGKMDLQFGLNLLGFGIGQFQVGDEV